MAAARSAPSSSNEALVQLAVRALDEAVEMAQRDSASEEGCAIAELRAMLCCEGLGGARYYSGPAWLPSYFALLEVIAAPREVSERGVGIAPSRARELLIALSSARGGAVSDALPDALMFRLLEFFGGVMPRAFGHEPMLVGHSPLSSAESASMTVYSAADTHVLLRELEVLKGSLLNTAPAEGPNSRVHSLPSAERALSLALSESLAEAILDQAARASRGSCWGAAL